MTLEVGGDCLRVVAAVGSCCRQRSASVGSIKQETTGAAKVCIRHEGFARHGAGVAEAAEQGYG
jgi:hypothetical protein